MKKGQTSMSISFLSGLIITLLILIPLALWGWSSCITENEMKDCFDVLSGNLSNLKDGEMSLVNCNTDDNMAIVVFGPGKKVSSSDSPYFVDLIFDFETVYDGCKDNSCICLCGFRGEDVEKCGDDEAEKCVKLDWTKKIVGGIAFTGGITSNVKGQTGLLDLGHKPLLGNILGVTHPYFMLNIERQALPIYFQRDKDTLGICFSENCFDVEEEIVTEDEKGGAEDTVDVFDSNGVSTEQP